MRKLVLLGANSTSRTQPELPLQKCVIILPRQRVACSSHVVLSLLNLVVGWPCYIRVSQSYGPAHRCAMRSKLKPLCFWLDIRCKRPADSEWLALMTPSFNRGEQKELGNISVSTLPKPIPPLPQSPSVDPSIRRKCRLAFIM